jgi:hypothetical protein
MTDAAGIATAQLTATASVVVSVRALDFAAYELPVPIRAPAIVALTSTPAQPVAGKPVTLTLTAMIGDQPALGRARLEFGNGEIFDLGQVTGTATTTRTFVQGAHDVTAVFNDEGFDVRQTLRLNVTAVPVPPTLPPPPPGSTADQIDPREITWLSNSADVGGWAVTSQLTSVDINGSTICLPHSKAGQWPTVRWGDTPTTQVDFEATPMIVAKVNGRWYGAAFDWFRVGATCKNVTPDEFGRDQIRVSPLDASWPGPQPGELVGFLVSAPSSNRIALRSVFERSNIVLVRWPGGERE